MIDINAATVEELCEISGIGPKTAAKLVKNRPIRSPEEVEALVPPSSWLKVKEVVGSWLFAPEKAAETPAGDAAPVEEVPEAPHPPEPITGMVVDGVKLRRLLSTEAARFEKQFGGGTRFLCLWNMKWGPALEAVSPNDTPVQAEISEWFKTRGMHVSFAHYGPSVRVGTKARGFVPVLLFEILEEEEEEKGATNT